MIFLFIIANVLIIIHTYKFTHYDASISPSLNENPKIGLKEIFLGIDIPRPINTIQPKAKFETIDLSYDNKTIRGWLIKSDSLDTKGVILMAHGYLGSKSKMLPKTDIFLANGYDIFLFDFMGTGDSDGNQTTIGYRESEMFKVSYEFLEKEYNENIILFGTSMGAVAIMKAVHDYPSFIKPEAVILECPYSTLLQAVKARFKIMNLPQWIAYPFTFWGGIINGFNAFDMRPIDYASSITAPTLLIYGKNDDKVSVDETLSIYNLLNEPKDLKIYPNSGHDDYLKQDKERWTNDMQYFIKQILKKKSSDNF